LLPTTYKLGFWYATGPFDDQRYRAGGTLLAGPGPTGVPRTHAGDDAVYGIIDQAVWRRPGTSDQGIGVFLEAIAGPSDRNLSNLSFVAGANWRGPFPSRSDDVAGLAVAYLGISPAAQAYSHDLVAFGQAAQPYAADETVFEATYQAPITSWLSVQPDAQFIINPGAGIPGSFGRRPLANALVLGLRATIKM
jgi:porin